MEVNFSVMYMKCQRSDYMKVAIGIFVLSTFLYFIEVKPSLDTYNTWINIKFVSFLTMVVSFIAILIMW